MKKQLLTLVGLSLAAITMFVSGCRCPMKGSCCKKKCHSMDSITFDNATFYDADGKFDVERGKDAVIALMKYHGYPVYPNMRKELWVSDYGTGKFTEVGLAARMWRNNVKDRYMLMDLFMLPNQMLPEHWHLAGTEAGVKVPAKLEGWLVRYGSSHIMGEGDNNMTFEVPKSHNLGKVTVFHDNFCKAGDFAELNRVGAHHWQKAGATGAIITETANCHCGEGVRHLDKGVNDNFLGK